MDEAVDKSYQPTQKKLDDARKKGEIPRSQEVGIAVTYFSLAITLYLFGGTIFEEAFTLLKRFLEPNLWFQANQNIYSYTPGLSTTTVSTLTIVSPLVFASFSVIVLMIIVQRTAIPVGSNLSPKMERISILSGLKKKFGANGFFEFFKSSFKLLLYSATLTIILWPMIAEVSNMSRLQPESGILYMLDVSLMIIFITTLISCMLAVIDFIWQQDQFTKKNMMSFQELKDEVRDAEGDPIMKGARRQRALEIASNRMLADVPKADVVIVNPTHYAVALEWRPSIASAPIVIAKGLDEVAIRIKLIASQNGIPIYSDIPTARALTSLVKVGDEIPFEHYEAVAVAIKFAQSAQNKKI